MAAPRPVATARVLGLHPLRRRPGRRAPPVITRLLGDDRPKTLAIATGLGAASSSCSYAAVALARSLFRKGANFTAAMAFQIASTNLVIELGIILILLMGWEFAAAEFVGGPIMIVVLALLFRLFLQAPAARRRPQAGRAGHGRLHGGPRRHGHERHRGRLAGCARLTSAKGFTSVSHIFVMEWAAVLRDIVIGLLIAGAIAAWVPDSFWQAFFLVDHPLLAKIWGPLDRPGRRRPQLRLLDRQRAPGRGAVERRDQLRRRGQLHLRRPADPADPGDLPEVLRQADGAVPAVTFYLASVVAGYVVEILFGARRPRPRPTATPGSRWPHISWNYTTYLNIAFLLLAAVLVVRFLRTGGLAMLTMMGGGPDDMAGHDHSGHDIGWSRHDEAGAGHDMAAEADQHAQHHRSGEHHRHDS